MKVGLALITMGVFDIMLGGPYLEVVIIAAGILGLFGQVGMNVKITKGNDHD